MFRYSLALSNDKFIAIRFCTFLLGLYPFRYLNYTVMMLIGFRFEFLTHFLCCLEKFLHRNKKSIDLK